MYIVFKKKSVTTKRKKISVNNTNMSATKKLVNTASVSRRKIVAKIERLQKPAKSVKVSDVDVIALFKFCLALKFTSAFFVLIYNKFPRKIVIKWPDIRKYSCS